MAEPSKKAKQVRKLVEQLNKIADKAEELGLLLPNGAMVDGVIGSVANDLGMMIEDGAFDHD